MPPCFCFSNRCKSKGGLNSDGKPRGVDLSARLVSKHAQDDRIALLEEAEKRANKVIDDERAAISEYLSSNTLADSFRNVAEEPGGRLWSRPFPSTPSPISQPSKRSHPQAPASVVPSPKDDVSSTSSRSKANPKSLERSREDEVLKVLANLKEEIDAFISSTRQQVDALSGPPALASHSSPFPLTECLDSVVNFRRRVDTVTLKTAATSERTEALSKALDNIQTLLESSKEQWWRSVESRIRQHTPAYGHPYSTAHHYEPILENADPVLQVTFFMLVAARVVLGVGRRGCNFLFAAIGYIIQLTILRRHTKLSPADQKLLADIPSDSRYVDDRFNLQSKATIFAVCPKADCHARHAPKFNSGSPIPSYPTSCSHAEFVGGTLCGTPLLQYERIQGTLVGVPIKRFVAFGFTDWLGGLLSRPGMEDLLDKSWERCGQGDDNRTMRDISDGDMLRSFKGPDGKHFSVGGDEGRYVFSLGLDFFNPLGNKQAGKKKSVGMVSLVCCSLPIEIRYQPENMFLYGVIPGPNEPPLTCLNPYLGPLVDELQAFWSPGIRYSRTFNYHYGRVVLAALICVVCDLLAARKTIGFAGLKHKQKCAICHCTQESYGLGNTDIDSWKWRTKEEFIQAAERHRKAEDSTARQAIVDETGMRWSELLRLPYFDPSRHAVVDAMHNLFLGLVHEHFNILGIQLDGDAPVEVDLSTLIPPESYEHLTKNEQASMRRLINTIEAPITQELQNAAGLAKYQKKLDTVHKTSLELALDRLQVPLLKSAYAKKTSIYKADYINALLLWRRDLELDSSKANFKRGSILTKADVMAIRDDIQNIVTPSWLTSLPPNLGEASHGKLKADQWRTLATVYLPISLVRLWGALSENPHTPHHEKLLATTLSLISAINVASARSTSRKHANLYTKHMQDYLNGIRELLPDYSFRPNHHMALHLGEYLVLYGPVHGWWTFPFERLIGLLQNISTNFKNGELEETIATSFVRAANLRALLSKNECPEAIRNCKVFFQKLVDPQVRNTLLSDISSFQPESPSEHEPTAPPTRLSPLANSTYQALNNYLNGKAPRSAKTMAYHTLNGRTFSIASRHQGNASVLVQQSGGVTPAQIEDIFQTSTNEIFFAVRFHRDRASKDPFENYPALRIKLWKPRLDQVVIIRPKQITGHFASTSFVWNNEQCTAVISLSHESKEDH